MRHLLVVLAAFAGMLVALAQPPESVAPTVATEDSIHAPSVSSPPRTKTESVLSTDMGATDTLDVLPDVFETSDGGGTRRITLERSVFRRQQAVAYVDNGRRDPFRALLTDKRNEGEIETDLLVLDGALLTGVVWSDGQYLAMVKDKDGTMFFLREGDEIYGGHVLTVTNSQAIFEIASFGSYQRTTLKVRG